jgi:2-isopropylmalate synthase
MARKIDIFDTTLRDGEQAPGNKMRTEDKIRMARKLCEMGVDVIEAGFPASSPGDFESVSEIARLKETENNEIAGLARIRYTDNYEEVAGAGQRKGWVDIDRAWEAVQHATHPKIHIFIGTSPIHLKYKFGDITLEDAADRAVEAVKYIHKKTGGRAKIEVSAEDAGRTDNKQLAWFAQTVAQYNIDVFNVPDTVGYCQPDEFGEKVNAVYKALNEVKKYKTKVSVHCHNDLGNAIANSMSGIKNGAEQVEVALLGIGERAGNASLEQVVMNLKTRQDYFSRFGSPYTNIVIKELGHAAGILSNIIAMEIPANSPIVGKNAFAHEAGIHAAGVLSNTITYEIMGKEEVGWIGESIVAGSHMGKKSIKEIIGSQGYTPTDKQVSELFSEVKKYADRVRIITHGDVEAIYRRLFMKDAIMYDVHANRFGKNDDGSYYAEVTVSRNGSQYIGKVGKRIDLDEAKSMTGPVDAVITAIKKALQTDRIIDEVPSIATFLIKATGSGSNAMGMASITAQNSHLARGSYASQDIVEASAKAYINAVNSYIWEAQKKGAF